MAGLLAFTALTGDVKDFGQASAGVFAMVSAPGAYTAPARSRGVGDLVDITVRRDGKLLDLTIPLVKAEG